MAKSKKRLVVVSAAIVLALGAGVMFIGANQGGNAAAEPEEVDSRIVVETAQPEQGDIVVTGEFIGTVEPGQQVTIYPKAAGEILEVMANVGDTIQEGDVLFRIDSKALERSIAQSQATVASAQARAGLSLEMAEKDRDTTLDNIKDGYDTALQSAEAQVKSAENRLQTAAANVTAARRAVREFRDEEDTYTVIGLNDYDQQMDKLHDAQIQMEIAYEGAQLSLEQAKEALETAKKGTETRTEAADDAVRLAEINSNMSDQYIAIQKLQDDLANYTVKSPISGVIEQRNVEAYDMASPQAAAFVISNKEALSIAFNVSEATVRQLKVGERVVVDKNGITSSGEITEITTMVNSRTGLFTVKATVKNPATEMLSGSSVKIFADVEKEQGTLTVPIDAVYYDNSEPYVYVAESGAVKKVMIETGIADDERIQVTSGIAADDAVITTWNPNLADGLEVRIYGQEAAEAPSEEEAPA